MLTTALIVEVLVIGAMTMIWLAGLIAAFLPLPNLPQLISLTSFAREASALLVIPTLALTYALGWITNFCSENVLKIFHQHQIRDHLFGNKERYEAARLGALQYGSSDLVQEVLIDRHIIRLARGGVVNFAMMGVVLCIHATRGHRFIWPVALLCIVLSTLSFAQFKTRHNTHYERLRLIDKFLSSTSKQSGSA